MLELRRLADSYRRRAEGTHFVQVHLADIEGEDDGEEAASTVSSCSVCRHQQQQQQPPRSYTPPAKSHGPTSSRDPVVPVTKPQIRTPPIKSCDPEVGSHDPQDDTESNASEPTRGKQVTKPPTGQGLPHNDNEASIDEESEPGGPQGRLPTPELKQIPPARKIRHHLDRTTPCKGAILTSPPKEACHGWNPEDDNDEEDPLMESTIPPGVTKILPGYRRDMTSRAPIYPSHASHPATDHQERSSNITTRNKRLGSKRTVTQQQRNLYKTHTLVSNRKTTATTANRKMKATENDDLECSFCGSPLRQPTTTHKSSRLVADDNRPLAIHRIITGPSTVTTTNVPQQPRITQLPPQRHLSQQQPLSGSLLSLSSCSVASEVLQRAQHRKATFWNQRETAAT